VDTKRGPIVSVAWLMAELDRTPNVKIIDARPEQAYRQFHISGALSWDQNLLRIPDSRPESVAHFHRQAEAEIQRLGIVPEDRVVFYEDYSGSSAARGVWALDYLGLGGGAMLDGGLAAWHAAGGELTRVQSEVEPSRTTIHPDDSVLALAGEIRAGIEAETPSIRVLDSRNAMEHRAGTIPTATLLDWADHLDAEGRLRPLDELATLYRDAGFDPESPEPIVTFCGSGFRAAHSYLVLKALGYPSVKNYVPSWGEWGRRPDLPIERPHG
jgi:thiosulfate/3-mercaptopyruvate sulfurtransferase